MPVTINNRINLCFATDENYAHYLLVTIGSILLNAAPDDDLHIYILCNKVSKPIKDVFLDVDRMRPCTIYFLDVDKSLFKNCPFVSLHISLTTYYRYIIATLIPEIGKVLYLDCDMIVEKSLRELFNTDISDYYIAGVEDFGAVYSSKYARELSRYINAGVILINLKKWRSDNIEKKLFETTQLLKDRLTLGDQDVINVLMHDKCLLLNHRWNVQHSFFKEYVSKNSNCIDIIAATKEPYIIHYTSRDKPWHNNDVPYRDIYWKYHQIIFNHEHLGKHLSVFNSNKYQPQKILALINKYCAWWKIRIKRRLAR